MSAEQYAVVVPIPATLFDEHGAVPKAVLATAREVAHERLNADAERHGFTLSGSITGEVIKPEDTGELWVQSGMGSLVAGAYRVLAWVSV